MTVPAAVMALSAPLLAAYRAAWADVSAAEDAIVADPRPWRRIGTRSAFLSGVGAAMDDLDARTASFFAEDFPDIYRAGAEDTAADLGRTYDPTTSDHEARIVALAAVSLVALRRATRGVRRTARALMGTLARHPDLLAGPSPDLTRLVTDGRVHAVRYTDRSRHGLSEYAYMALDTSTVTGYNAGTLGMGAEAGVNLYLVSDGPMCVMPGTRSVFYGGIVGLVRAWYSGDAVRLTYTGADGSAHVLTVGPHHPVLTRRGWIVSGLLNEGDEVVYDARVKLSDALAELDLQQVPTVANAFAAMVNSGGCTWKRPATSEDLHGDGRSCDGEIEVVRPARNLLVEAHASFSQHHSEVDLVAAYPTLPLVSSSSDPGLFVGSLSSPGGGDVSGSYLSRARLGRGVLPLVVDRASAGAEPDRPVPIRAGEDRVALVTVGGNRSGSPAVEALVRAESRGSDVVLGMEFGLADLANGDPSMIPGISLAHARCASLVKIEHGHYDGWVYDATTGSGVFGGEGIVLKNCGWSFHDDPDRANASLRTALELEEFPLAHAHCRRSAVAFLPSIFAEATPAGLA